MKEVKIIRNGREYSALETRNIEAGECVKGVYREEGYKITVRHNGLMSSFYLKPSSYWDGGVKAGSFHYDLTNDKITYFATSDYDPQFIFVFKKLVSVLQADDVVFISIKRGRMIDRYRCKAGVLQSLIGLTEDKYGQYPVSKEAFEKLKSKVWRGDYAKKRTY